MKKTNLLFLFPDQWRGDWTGFNPDIPLRTPTLDALGRGGVRFTQCRSNSPLCIPARACLSQGVRYGRNGAPDNHAEMPQDRLTFFQLLRGAGYRTLSCGKSDIHGHSRFYADDGFDPVMNALGFCDSIDQRGKLNSARAPEDKPGPYVDFLRQRGLMRDHMADYAKRREAQPRLSAAWPTPLPRDAYTDDFATRSALKLLEETPKDAPWFLWVNFPGPHDPWDAPADLLARTQDDVFPGPVNGEDGYDHQAIRRNYAAMMAGIDDGCRQILDAVRERGELENTLIVFASDHGELLGDHGLWNKSHWREASVHVPLFVSGPGMDAGRTDDRPVELIDLAAVFLEAAGLEVPADWDARSVFGEARVLQHAALRESHKDNAGWEMVCDTRWKLVQHDDGRRELYHLESDPQELHNRIGDALEIAAELEQALTSI